MQSVGREQEQLLEKYRAMGFSEEAVVLGLLNYGDETESVCSFFLLTLIMRGGDGAMCARSKMQGGMGGRFMSCF